MGRSWAASLIIGVLVSAALLTLYHVTDIFYHAVFHTENFLHSILVLPARDLQFYRPAQYAYYTVMAFVSAWVCLELPRNFSRIAFIGGAVFMTFLLAPALAFAGIIFEPFSGAAAILASGLAGSILGISEPGQRRHKLLRYFVGRLSTEKFQQMVTAKEAVDISGKKEITVLACRILNYPDLSSQMEPHDLEQMSSLFLQVTAEFLVARGAYLDACNAEGVRVFFGLPTEDPEHALHACRAALELRQRLINLEQEMQNRWHRKPFFGAALASGPMSIGLFGFREFQFYSAVGEAVDFSRRLASINLVYGSHVLMNARTFHLAQDQMEMRPMEMVYAPRMHQISEVYELLAEKGSLSDEEIKARDAFWQGVISLRKGAYKEALQQLKTAQMEGREDAPLKYFLERAEAGTLDQKTASDVKGTARHVRMLTVN